MSYESPDATGTCVTRREILEKAAFAAGVAAAVSAAPTSALAASAPKLSKGDVVLFQGDSITDAGRNKGAQKSANNPRALGFGYPQHIAGSLLRDHAALQLRIHNTGISGHKVPQLDARWQKDTVDFKPRVLSILIGVNDIWHKLNGRYEGSPELYKTGYAALLEKTKKLLPDTTIVVCEPFALKVGAVKDNWFPEMDHMRAAAKEVATGAGAMWVPFQTMFDTAIAAGTAPGYWAGDGVHPSLAGHALMAATWRKVVGI